VVNYEQLLRDLDVVRAWSPDLVVLDEAQRIKNWATKTALTVKQLDPPFRLVLTGTPMENRIDELASIVEWVDDLALEPKWRLVPWHTTPVDGKTEIGGARNLDTLRSRLAGCMIRRIRKEVLRQLPERTDTRIPIEMTPEQVEEHDALNMPIAQLLSRAKRRPLTQAEFLRLMMLLTTQRIIANGLAQLRFELIWPDLFDYFEKVGKQYQKWWEPKAKKMKLPEAPKTDGARAPVRPMTRPTLVQATRFARPGAGVPARPAAATPRPGIRPGARPAVRPGVRPGVRPLPRPSRPVKHTSKKAKASRARPRLRPKRAAKKGRRR